MHLEDIAEDRKHNHLIPGKGNINFRDIFERMHMLDYRGDVSLELYPYVDMPEQAGLESLEFLKPLFMQAGLGIG